MCRTFYVVTCKHDDHRDEWENVYVEHEVIKDEHGNFVKAEPTKYGATLVFIPSKNVISVEEE